MDDAKMRCQTVGPLNFVSINVKPYTPTSSEILLIRGPDL